MTETLFAAQMACHDIYDPVTEGVFDKVIKVNEDTIGIKRTRDAVWIVAAGTENLEGWLNDADILTEYVPGIGPVHMGFSQNVSAFMQQTTAWLGTHDVIKIAGHSRGAPIVAILAARLIQSGFKVAAAYLFESPKFCYKLGSYWLCNKIPAIVSTRCVAKWLPLLGDPVTLFPEPDPWQPWAAPAPQKIIYGSPKGLRKLSAVAYHSGQIVIDAVNASKI